MWRDISKENIFEGEALFDILVNKWLYDFVVFVSLEKQIRYRMYWFGKINGDYLCSNILFEVPFSSRTYKTNQIKKTKLNICLSTWKSN